jgi:hypothetical protein
MGHPTTRKVPLRNRSEAWCPSGVGDRRPHPWWAGTSIGSHVVGECLADARIGGGHSVLQLMLSGRGGDFTRWRVPWLGSKNFERLQD